MYKVIKRLKVKKKIKNNKKDHKILSMAIIMFISFSILNVFLIFNFINILSSVTKI